MQRPHPFNARIVFAWLAAAGFLAGLPATAADVESGVRRADGNERVILLVVRTNTKPVAEATASIVVGNGQYMLASAGGDMTGKSPRWTGAPATGGIRQDNRRRFDAPSCPLEAQLFADAADGRLDTFSLLDACLVAGGVQDADGLQRYHEKASAMADELRRLDTPGDSPRQRIEVVFEFMHRRILRSGYDLTYTDLRRVLDEGRYNCVSATVLLNYLAGEIGLECRGLEMPGHAMSRAVLPEGTFDIENTCPRWFRLDESLRQAEGAKAVRVQNGSKLQSDRAEYEKACRGDRSKAREVSAIQLAAMIYYNLGVDLLNAKHFAEAAGANAKAVRLDPKNATARGNLLATINNWSIELSNRGQFAEAVDLLRQGLAINAKFEAFAQNYVHVHRQWVEHLCGERRFGEAIEILSRATAEMPDRDYLRKAQKEVRQRWEKSVAASPAD